MIMMLVFSLIGLALGIFIPRRAAGTEQPAESTTARSLVGRHLTPQRGSIIPAG
jgi:F0F1-type ATP synthase assembly protein I